MESYRRRRAGEYLGFLPTKCTCLLLWKEKMTISSVYSKENIIEHWIFLDSLEEDGSVWFLRY